MLFRIWFYIVFFKISVFGFLFNQHIMFKFSFFKKFFACLKQFLWFCWLICGRDVLALLFLLWQGFSLKKYKWYFLDAFVCFMTYEIMSLYFTFSLSDSCFFEKQMNILFSLKGVCWILFLCIDKTVYFQFVLILSLKHIMTALGFRLTNEGNQLKAP